MFVDFEQEADLLVIIFFDFYRNTIDVGTFGQF